MTKRLSLLLGAVSLGAISFCGPSIAAPHGVKVGMLTCHVHPGWGYVVGSSKGMDCVYRPRDRGPDYYKGNISKLGVDIGYTSGGTLVWDVIAPSSDIRPGALEGVYGGASASATVGVGIGANALVGGLDKSIALQPVSVEGNTGLNVSGGIGEMNLKAERQADAR